MKHKITDKHTKYKETVVNNYNTFIPTDTCIYCGLTGDNIIYRRIAYESIKDHLAFLNTEFPCLTDEEFLIKQIIE